MKIDRIVIAVDFSPSSIDAVRWTVQRFRDAELMLAHVIDVPELPTFIRRRHPSSSTYIEAARDGALLRLRSLAEGLSTPRVNVAVRVGRPVDEITVLAREWPADLIVAGRDGEGRRGPRQLGRIAERLVRCSPVPVLLATGIERPSSGHLLVAIDDASTTPRVIEAARQLATQLDGRLTALHVVSIAVLSHVLSMAAISDRGELSPKEIQQEFRLDTDRWIRAMVDTGIEPTRVASEVAFGDPAAEILAAADRLDADLIVMGSRGRGPIRRALLGSVVSDVLRATTRPVFVAIEPEDEIVVAAPDSEAALVRMW